MLLKDAIKKWWDEGEGEIVEGVEEAVKHRLTREAIVEHVINLNGHKSHILEVEDVRCHADAVVIPVTVNQNQTSKVSKKDWKESVSSNHRKERRKGIECNHSLLEKW